MTDKSCLIQEGGHLCFMENIQIWSWMKRGQRKALINNTHAVSRYTCQEAIVCSSLPCSLSFQMAHRSNKDVRGNTQRQLSSNTPLPKLHVMRHKLSLYFIISYKFSSVTSVNLWLWRGINRCGSFLFPESADSCTAPCVISCLGPHSPSACTVMMFQTSRDMQPRQ